MLRTDLLGGTGKKRPRAPDAAGFSAHKRADFAARPKGALVEVSTVVGEF